LICVGAKLPSTDVLEATTPYKCTLKFTFHICTILHSSEIDYTSSCAQPPCLAIWKIWKTAWYDIQKPNVLTPL
jgi:hypothetical protein